MEHFDFLSFKELVLCCVAAHSAEKTIATLSGSPYNENHHHIYFDNYPG
jgi:hypothetical protein